MLLLALAVHSAPTDIVPKATNALTDSPLVSAVQEEPFESADEDANSELTGDIEDSADGEDATTSLAQSTYHGCPKGGCTRRRRHHPASHRPTFHDAVKGMMPGPPSGKIDALERYQKMMSKSKRTPAAVEPIVVGDEFS